MNGMSVRRDWEVVWAAHRSDVGGDMTSAAFIVR